MTQRSIGSRTGLACLAALALLGEPAQSVAQSGGESGKVPVTTSSSEARAQYLKGRALGENLRAYDSRQFLTAAVEKDSGFALAHYSLALNAGNAKDFFAHLKQAVALSSKASEGERLMMRLRDGSIDITRTIRRSPSGCSAPPSSEFGMRPVSPGSSCTNTPGAPV